MHIFLHMFWSHLIAVIDIAFVFFRVSHFFPNRLQVRQVFTGQVLFQLPKHQNQSTERKVRKNCNHVQCSEVVLGNWQELLELAQRKFLRQVIQYADAMETSLFPRLFVLDFLSDEEKASLKAAEEAAGRAADEQAPQCPLAAAEAAAAAPETPRSEVSLTLHCDTE